MFTELIKFAQENGIAVGFEVEPISERLILNIRDKVTQSYIKRIIPEYQISETTLNSEQFEKHIFDSIREDLLRNRKEFAEKIMMRSDEE